MGTDSTTRVGPGGQLNPRPGLEDRLTESLVQIVEDEMRTGIRALQTLQQLLPGRSGDPSLTPSHPMAAAPVAFSAQGGSGSADPSSGNVEQLRAEMQAQRAEFERERAEFLNAQEQRFRTLEQTLYERYGRLLEETASRFEADCRASLEQVEQVLRTLEDAGLGLTKRVRKSKDGPATSAPTKNVPAEEKVAPKEQIAKPAPVDSADREPEPEPKVNESTAALKDRPAAPAKAPTNEPTQPAAPDDESTEDGAACRRSSRRFKVEFLTSNLGQVVDLSLTGARIVSHGPLEGEVSLDMSTDDHSLSVPAEVIWCERRGWRHYQAGLSFKELSEEQAKILTSICMASRTRTTLQPLAGD